LNQRTDLVRDPARLRALRSLGALDTPPDEKLDALANLARESLQVPVSLVTLVDEDRQFFLSCPGLGAPWKTTRESPLSHSFCKHTLGVDRPLSIDDARADPMVKDNGAIKDMGVVAYLGVPLVTNDGQQVGAFCAIDREPRQWTEQDTVTLGWLARASIRQLETSARIRELEESHKALSERESYFRSLIERGMDAVLVLDAHDRIRYSSPGSEVILGVPPGERAGGSPLKDIHPSDRNAVRAELERVKAAPDRTGRIRFRHRHPKGNWVHVEGVGRNLLHAPEVQGVVFSIRDVTRNVELEKELLHRRKIETIGELTAGIAHDFNNLLAVVLSNAELLRDPLAKEEAEAIQDLEDLTAAARSGAELVRALMTFARQGEPSIRPTDLGRVVEQAARMLRRILPSSIAVECEATSELPPALADPRSVEQILLNLATNARDAMPQGGALTIRLRVEEGEPEDPIFSGRALVLEVADTGRGMDEETAARAFDPFFTTKPAGRGTGLGLAMVARVVAAHGGTVQLESVVGEGTRVTVRLPATTVPTGDEGLSSLDLQKARPGETVLLVEDQEALRRTARRVLERAGYQVLEATDGVAGLEVFRSHRDDISLVLSDQDMPERSGTQLLKEIREMGSTVPFLLTTGATRRDVRRGHDLDEEVRVVPKPWMVEDLIRAIREALDGVGGS
jgi:PAS domain S-box-containing protein